MEASSTPPAPAGRRPIEVGRVLSESFNLYGNNFVPLMGVGLAIAIVFGIVIGFLQEEGGFVLQVVASILQLVATYLYTGFVVKLVQDVRDGRRDSSVGELISAAMPSLLSLIVFAIFAGILIAIGFVLLIIPGLILMTIWSVGAPAIVAERLWAFDAFGRSYDLVRGQAWRVFGVIVSVFLILLVTTIVVAAIGGAIGGVAGAAIVAGVLLILYIPVQALVQTVLYFDLAGGEAPSDRQVVVEY